MILNTSVSNDKLLMYCKAVKLYEDTFLKRNRVQRSKRTKGNSDTRKQDQNDLPNSVQNQFLSYLYYH